MTSGDVAKLLARLAKAFTTWSRTTRRFRSSRRSATGASLEREVIVKWAKEVAVSSSPHVGVCPLGRPS